MPELEKTALQLCSGKVMDIGVGCHTLVLQERGFEVVSLDYRRYLVELMVLKDVKNLVFQNILMVYSLLMGKSF